MTARPSRAASSSWSRCAPDPELVTFEPPPGSELPDRGGENLDLVQAIERYSDTELPDTLAGLPRRTDVANAAATYGEGFDVVGVLALPEEFITDTLRALPTSERPWGQTVALVRTPLAQRHDLRRGRHGLHRRRPGHRGRARPRGRGPRERASMASGVSECPSGRERSR